MVKFVGKILVIGVHHCHNRVCLCILLQEKERKGKVFHINSIPFNSIRFDLLKGSSIGGLRKGLARNGSGSLWSSARMG